MTPTPNFNDLTPPDELISDWQQQATGTRLVVDYRLIKFASLAARWGAREGWEQARQLWPEPITDRPPTEEDGDDLGRIQYLRNGNWSQCRFNLYDEDDGGWRHTPRWQPRQSSLQEQAIAAADEALQPANLSFTLQNADRLVAALSLCRRALEQAGEGQA